MYIRTTKFSTQNCTINFNLQRKTNLEKSQKSSIDFNPLSYAQIGYIDKIYHVKAT